MKLVPNFLEYFISPCTGRLSGTGQLPSLTEGNIWVGDADNVAVETDNYVSFGSTSSTNGNIAIFDGTSGHSIVDGGMSIPDLKTLADEAAASASDAAASALAAAGSASAAGAFATSAESSATAAAASASSATASAAAAATFAAAAADYASEAADSLSATEAARDATYVARDAAAASEASASASASAASTSAASAASILNQLSYSTKTVSVSSTANLTATYSNGTAGVGATLTNSGTQAAFSIDGQTPAVNTRVLIKNQSTTFQNGIYTLTNVGSVSTNWVLTRAVDFNTPTNINNTGIITVILGTSNADTSWILDNAVATIGTDAITFTQFGVGVTTPLPLSQGGTQASLTASNGGIFYSTATSGAILAGTATARKMLQSGTSAAPAWSSTTWPATSTINQILYSSSTNTVVGLATAIKGVLVTDASGVPSILTGGTGNQMLQSSSSGAPTWSTTTWPATSTINRILYSSASNTISQITTANSSVLVTDGSGVPSLSTTLPSGIAATNMSLTTPTLGAATATSITFSPTTSGIVGTTTNDNASSGKVGEFLENTTTGVTLTSGGTSNVTSVTLSAGDWDVFGTLEVVAAGTITLMHGGLTTSTTVPPANTAKGANMRWVGSVVNDTLIFTVGRTRFSVSGSTTVNVLISATFTSTAAADAYISARRVR